MNTRRLSRILLLLPALAGCGPEGNVVTLAANVAALPVFGRTLPDLAFSAISGRDCSMVRVEQGKTWCRDAEAPPAQPVFCTRSLGVVDCWVGAEAQPLPRRRGVADGPAGLTAVQERNRTRSWPGLTGDLTPSGPAASATVGP